MPACFACGKEVVVVDRVGRAETCSHCGADLHCCRNCKFYDPAAYNECLEPVAERVVEKEKSNFCDFYQIAERPCQAEGPRQDARKKLDEFFRKK